VVLRWYYVKLIKVKMQVMSFGDAVRFLGVEILSRISEFLLGKAIFVKGL
jgi:hypothetical protein